ncbi:type II toxin-antitoxin system PemK/MazF family toxin [Candidatus Epulonipiscium viviparus]|uniref:type II toxin-antitoxin system PemK/MazF family toxin n=1 Tax=Candidatus Epulonipiscium viviparus TaxID=420336 RepID=UPI00016C0460|nr:type II toxin-antitoxin system PemK/MazF family toxin [Candidatus Epulopiscium viviparus]
MIETKDVKYIYPKRGEIYEADLGIGDGSEQAGIRPVLIIQNNTGNHYSPTVICVPLTSKCKKPMPTHHTLTKTNYGFLTYDSIILCEQIKTISKSRLSHRIGLVGQEDMKTIGEKLCVSIAL